jgi:hypothetical protein
VGPAVAVLVDVSVEILQGQEALELGGAQCRFFLGAVVGGLDTDVVGVVVEGDGVTGFRAGGGGGGGM